MIDIEYNSSMKFVTTVLNETKILRNENIYTFSLKFYFIFNWKLKKKKVAQSCPTLSKPMNYTVHGILQARIVEWVAFPFCRGSSQPRDPAQVSRIAGGFFTG